MQFAGRIFMEKINRVIEDQKKLLVLIEKYELKTRELLSCDFDDVTVLVASRQGILDRMEVLRKEILRLCPEGSDEYAAFQNSCDRDSLPDIYKQIFDLRQQFNAYAFRAKTLEPEIIGRLSIHRDKMLVKIKENNSGQTAKAAKFFNTGMSAGNNFYFKENKKQI